jgi:hypothetical protein
MSNLVAIKKQRMMVMLAFAFTVVLSRPTKAYILELIFALKALE